MKKKIFTGSGVAIVTPFKANGSVDFDKLGELIEFQIKNNTDAIIICGTTGESSTMPDDEHISVVKYACDKVAGRIPVVAGAGSNDTAHAINLSKACQECGADALLSVSPYYNKTTQAGLVAHFSAIANSVDIPIILYNVPGRTNLNINPETVAELAKLDNIVAIKECNLNQVGDVINLCPDDFTVYSGEDGLIVPLLSLGGEGVISVLANVCPQETHDIVKNYLDGNVDEARRLQLKYLKLISALFCETSPIPVKETMNQLGMDVGVCRLPLVEATENAKVRIENALKELNLI